MTSLARSACFAIFAAALIYLLPASNPITPLHASPRPLPENAAPIQRAPSAAPAGKLIFSAQYNGAWALYSAEVAGDAQKIALTLPAARDPALSPDGKTLAYRSKRDGVWEIYAQPLAGGNATRLTRGMIYSAAPAWSPDGKKIAFESYVRGDLDIWTVNADGTQLANLTEDSKAHDVAPAFSPDGKWIAFTSWRTGAPQIFIVAADCPRACKALNLSANKFNDQEPVWSPDGTRIAFVSDRDDQRAIYIAEFAVSGTPALRNARRITFSGWDDQPAFSPDGNWIAFVSPRGSRQLIYLAPADGGVPRAVDNELAFASSVAWVADTRALSAENANESRAALYQEKPAEGSATSGHPYDSRRLASVKVEPGINKLNSRVTESFLALQARVKQEVGYDFLGLLSDMMRPLELKCDNTCDTLSWHKAGRAVDTRLDYADAKGNSLLEIVREDMQGETYWRLFLRAAAQDGTQGEPLKDAPWDLSYRARWIVSPGDGGAKKPAPSGFYVDFTELAREYGWVRISSYDDPDFSWKTNKIAAEYWHYQKAQGLKWYEAIRELYSESDVRALTEWNALRRSDYDAYVLYLKAIPAPPKEWKWSALGP